MNLQSKEVDGVTVIRLEGSVLGGPDATALNDTLHKLAEKKRNRVVIDLSGVKTMNSSGLSMLINGLTTIRNAGGEMHLSGASKKLESLFVITKLRTVFRLFPTVKKAVESFSR